MLGRHIGTHIISLYDKRGATNCAEQISFIEDVLTIIPAERIECLAADREFGYLNFLSWLSLNKIPFCIRIRENSYMAETASGKWIKMKDKLRSLANGQNVVLAGTYLAKGKNEDAHLRIQTRTERWGRPSDSGDPRRVKVHRQDVPAQVAD